MEPATIEALKLLATVIIIPFLSGFASFHIMRFKVQHVTDKIKDLETRFESMLHKNNEMNLTFTKEDSNIFLEMEKLRSENAKIGVTLEEVQTVVEKLEEFSAAEKMVSLQGIGDLFQDAVRPMILEMRRATTSSTDTALKVKELEGMVTAFMNGRK